ncbi:hypothetical protein AOD75_0204630 [Helicobacter pylori]|uniref:hypothetical protein n=1 Tax=Helicobacter pylori TaxID=210 RepID=UPI000937A38F|nr:hypothetical protein [Helicobacter pylori]OKB20493.1 hypothetical protein AOD75_0204630 [Helicobacter pylori]
MKNLDLFLLIVGYKKILHFLRLDRKELIDAVSLNVFFMGIGHLVVGGNCFKIPLTSLRK